MTEFLVGLITGGGLITAWKWATGWNIVNLALAIENRRTSSMGTEMDDLVSILKLRKGDRATLALEGVRFVVSSDGKEIGRGTVEEIRPAELPRTLNITPGEETQFAAHFVVPARSVCKITVTVAGRSLRSRHAPPSAWTISDFSVPLPGRGQVKPSPLS